MVAVPFPLRSESSPASKFIGVIIIIAIIIGIVVILTNKSTTTDNSQSSSNYGKLPAKVFYATGKTQKLEELTLADGTEDLNAGNYIMMIATPTTSGPFNHPIDIMLKNVADVQSRKHVLTSYVSSYGGTQPYSAVELNDPPTNGYGVQDLTAVNAYIVLYNNFRTTIHGYVQAHRVYEKHPDPSVSQFATLTISTMQNLSNLGSCDQSGCNLCLSCSQGDCCVCTSSIWAGSCNCGAGCRSSTACCLPPGQYPACSSLQIPECAAVQLIFANVGNFCSKGGDAVSAALESACALIPEGQVICQLIFNVGVTYLCLAFTGTNGATESDFVNSVLGCNC
jgi:hypothetical protein